MNLHLTHNIILRLIFTVASLIKTGSATSITSKRRHTKRQVNYSQMSQPDGNLQTFENTQKRELRLLNDVKQPTVRGSYEKLPIMCLSCSTNSQDKACQNPTIDLYTPKRPSANDPPSQSSSGNLIHCSTASDKCGSANSGAIINFCKSMIGCYTKFRNYTKRSGVQTFKVLERGCLSERHTIAKSGLHINSMAGIHNLTCDSNPQPCNNMNAIDLQSDVEDRQSVVGMVSAFIGVKISVTKMILISILICLIGCIACCCMLLIGYCTGDDYNKLPREMR